MPETKVSQPTVVSFLFGLPIGAIVYKYICRKADFSGERNLWYHCPGCDIATGTDADSPLLVDGLCRSCHEYGVPPDDCPICGHEISGGLPGICEKCDRYACEECLPLGDEGYVCKDCSGESVESGDEVFSEAKAISSYTYEQDWEDFFPRDKAMKFLLGAFVIGLLVVASQS